MRDQVDFMY